MSRKIKAAFSSSPLIEIDDINKCKHMYNEVCCNDESECCGCYAFEDNCKRCELFEKEDGVIE